MKTAALQCPQPHLLANQRMADNLVGIAILLAVVFVVVLARQFKRPDVKALESRLKAHWSGELDKLKAAMIQDMVSLVEERDVLFERVEQLEQTNQALVSRIEKIQPSAVQSYELRAKLKGMPS